MERWVQLIRKMIIHFGWQRHFEKDKKSLEVMELLYVRENGKEKLYQLYYERIAILSIGFIILAVLGITCFFRKPGEDLKEGYYLERSDQEKEYELLVSMKDNAGKGLSETEKKMKFQIQTKRLTEEEKEEFKIQVKSYLDKVVPGKNKGLLMVSKRLYFPKSMPGSDVEIEWLTDEKYITNEGRLRKKNIAEEGIDTTVEAKASYRNWEETFSFAVFLTSGELSPEERMTALVKDGIRKSMKGQSTKQIIELPKAVGEVSLAFEETDTEKDYTPVMLGGFVLILLPFLWKEQQKKKLMAREREMLLDHPGFINQIMLLLSAGLTIRSAMERLVSEYEQNVKKGMPVRYTYEELWVTCNQMKNGISEEEAIERFGKRCRLLPYMRFSAIVTQNLKKGARGLIPLLEVDALEAFQRRKEMAKRLGDEAGTKILFPMMLMLVIVMGIIMVPAFMTL